MKSVIFGIAATFIIAVAAGLIMGTQTTDSVDAFVSQDNVRLD